MSSCKDLGRAGTSSEEQPALSMAPASATAHNHNAHDFRSDSAPIHLKVAPKEKPLFPEKKKAAPKECQYTRNEAWTKEEDQLVVELVYKFGPKRWSVIAGHLKGRIGKQCRVSCASAKTDLKQKIDGEKKPNI